MSIIESVKNLNLRFNNKAFNYKSFLQSRFISYKAQHIHGKFLNHNYNNKSLNLSSLSQSLSISTMSLSHISPHLRSIIAKRVPLQHPELDPSTNSNYQFFKISNTELDVSISFDEKLLRGTVTYEISLLQDVNEIILDTASLQIDQVVIDGNSVAFELKDTVSTLGRPLIISTQLLKDSSYCLQIAYTTTTSGTLLQFMDKEQTTGKTAPYVFTQCEPHYFRTMCPSFDTPSVKSTYQLRIESPLPSLMSGIPVESSVTAKPLHKPFTNLDNKYYCFEQSVPVPDYLIALVSGDIVGAATGPRSNVYSEPCEVAACKHEFEKDMENFIVIAEKLIFQYEFKTFDSVVLPLSFPYLGMENCNLCTLSRTLLSGDRQNVDVVAHELAHSWSGNLVTNCSWEHFWLNEGWTVYIERRITGALHGELTRHFSAIIGWTDLENSIKSMGENASRFSCLIQDLKDKTDPDDAFSTVPYEKGFNLLYHIECALGRENFDKYIPFYFNKFKKTSIDTYQFLDSLYEFFPDQKEILDGIDWQTWLFTPGLPPKPKFDTTLVDQCYQLGDKWIDAAKKELPESEYDTVFSIDDIKSFSSNQNVVFVDNLSSYEGTNGFSWTTPLGQTALRKMAQIYHAYNNSTNGEVTFRWLRLQLTGDLPELRQVMSDWLGTVGRMKFVRPGYRLLNKVDRDMALKTYEKYKGIYNPICLQFIVKDLSITE